MRKRLQATVLALVILSGTAFSEDVFIPGKRMNNKSWTDYVRAAWSFVVRSL